MGNLSEVCLTCMTWEVMTWMDTYCYCCVLDHETLTAFRRWWRPQSSPPDWLKFRSLAMGRLRSGLWSPSLGTMGVRHVSWGRGSLIPRPFPPPAFDCLYYAKNGGESLGERVTCITPGRREGRQRGSIVRLRNLEVLLLTACSRTWEHSKDSVNTARYSVDSKLINTKFVSYNDWAHPPPLPLPSTWHHAPDSFSQAFPLRFFASASDQKKNNKNWRQEWPGNEAKVGDLEQDLRWGFLEWDCLLHENSFRDLVNKCAQWCCSFTANSSTQHKCKEFLKLPTPLATFTHISKNCASYRSEFMTLRSSSLMLWQNIQEYPSRPLLHWKQQRWIKGLKMRLLSVFWTMRPQLLSGRPWSSPGFDFNFDLLFLELWKWEVCVKRLNITYRKKNCQAMAVLLYMN